MNQSQNQNLSSLVITNTDEFERIIRTLKESLNRMNDSFKNEKNFMKKIDKTDTWTGEVQEKVYSKYLSLSDCYDPVIESLGTYIKFLENTLNSYISTEMTINKNIENNIDELDVN